VEQSATRQDEAIEDLEGGHPHDARDDQEAALDQLEKALEALMDQQEGEQPQSDNQQDQGEQSQQQPQQKQGEPKPSPEEQMQAVPLTDTAKDILEEERENRERRRVRQPGGYRAVDKDW